MYYVDVSMNDESQFSTTQYPYELNKGGKIV